MVVSTRLAAAVMGGILLAAACTPAWAGSANDTTTRGAPTSTGASTFSGASSPVPGADHSLVGVLNPLLADTTPHAAPKSCKADTLYSQHDVIGDPNACFLNRVNVPIF
jgi:hypothetical protein